MMSDFRLNKKAFSIHKKGEEPKDFEYWLTQSAEQRISAIEFLRRQFHPDNGAQSRLQRIYSITQLPSG
jgi:hypothetical protein